MSGWVRGNAHVCGLVKNLRSCEGKRLKGNVSQDFTPTQTGAGFMFFQHLFSPSPPACVRTCMCVLCLDFIWLQGLIIICSFSGWKQPNGLRSVYPSQAWNAPNRYDFAGFALS